MTGARRSNTHGPARGFAGSLRKLPSGSHDSACAHDSRMRACDCPGAAPHGGPVSCNQCIKEAVDTGATRDRPIDFERVLQACGLLLV